MKKIIQEIYIVAGELDRLGLEKIASQLDAVVTQIADLHNQTLEATAAKRKIPKKYIAGLGKDKADKRKAEIRKRSKEPHTDPKAYRPFKTDIDKSTGKPIETEESKYTKEYRKKFGPTESDAKDSAALTKSLKKKSEDSGISVGILRQVYNRGLAAWRTGHRPGASQHAWGMARVNSFILKGKTWSTADADLAKKVRAKKSKKAEVASFLIFKSADEATESILPTAGKYTSPTPLRGLPHVGLLIEEKLGSDYKIQEIIHYLRDRARPAPALKRGGNPSLDDLADLLEIIEKYRKVLDNPSTPQNARKAKFPGLINLLEKIVTHEGFSSLSIPDQSGIKEIIKNLKLKF